MVFYRFLKNTQPTAVYIFLISTILETGLKLNLYEKIRRPPGRTQNVLCTFNFSKTFFFSWYQQGYVIYMYAVFKLYAIFCIFNCFALFYSFYYFFSVGFYQHIIPSPLLQLQVISIKNQLGLTVTLEIQCRGMYHPPFCTLPCLRMMVNSLSIEVKLSTLDWSTAALPT